MLQVSGSQEPCGNYVSRVHGEGFRGKHVGKCRESAGFGLGFGIGVYLGFRVEGHLGIGIHLGFRVDLALENLTLEDACQRAQRLYLPNKVNIRERESFIDNLLVRIHFIIVMIGWTRLAPWEFDFFLFR